MPLPLKNVPTMYVRFYREGGHVGLLNVADFNPERHEEVPAPGSAAPAPVSDEPTASAPPARKRKG